MKHILAAVDGSDASLRALTHAADLAQRLDAQLTVLIVRLIVVGRKGTYAAVGTEDIQAIQEKCQNTTAMLPPEHVHILVEKSRDTAFKIVDTAIDQKSDLIVMGASGIGGFKAFLLGSISQEVLRKAACPVTIVH